MLYEKAQKEVFAAIMSGKRVAGCMDGKGGFIVTPDACNAFVLPLSIIAFNLEKVENFEKLKNFFDDVKPENEIRLLPFTRDSSSHSRQRIRMLENHGMIVYAADCFFAYWQAPKFYQASGKPLETIIVTEKTGKGMENPVGFFMPMRCEFKETINIEKVENDEG